MFQRDYDKFKAIEEGVEKRGYSLKFGLTVGVLIKVFTALGKIFSLSGYLIGLKGGKTDKESLFDPVRFLKSQLIILHFMTMVFTLKNWTKLIVRIKLVIESD